MLTRVKVTQYNYYNMTHLLSDLTLRDVTELF